MRNERKTSDEGGEARTEARFVELEIKLAEMEFGQQQLDEVVLRQAADIRRLNRLVEQLGQRLSDALGDEPPAPDAASGADPSTRTSAKPRGSGGSPGLVLVDPDRPPHYSGPA